MAIATGDVVLLVMTAATRLGNDRRGDECRSDDSFETQNSKPTPASPWKATFDSLNSASGGPLIFGSA